MLHKKIFNLKCDWENHIFSQLEEFKIFEDYDMRMKEIGKRKTKKINKN